MASIGAGAFHANSELTAIDIPSGVTSIGSAAFSGCSKLTGIHIPKSVTNIGESAFDRCDSLNNLTIGSLVNDMRCDCIVGRHDSVLGCMGLDNKLENITVLEEEAYEN